MLVRKSALYQYSSSVCLSVCLSVHTTNAHSRRSNHAVGVTDPLDTCGLRPQLVSKAIQGPNATWNGRHKVTSRVWFRHRRRREFEQQLSSTLSPCWVTPHRTSHLRVSPVTAKIVTGHHTQLRHLRFSYLQFDIIFLLVYTRRFIRYGNFQVKYLQAVPLVYMRTETVQVIFRKKPTLGFHFRV
jgi:hypothetical protein